MGRYFQLGPAFVTGVASAVLCGTVLKQNFSVDCAFLSALIGLLLGVSGYVVLQWIRWELIRKLLQNRNWMYDQKSKKTKVWGIVLSTLMPKKNRLFDLQEYLPRYPLPTLEETCKRTLTMVKPLLSKDEFKDVTDAITDLQKTDGPRLQKVLEKRYKTEENWLSELWDKYVYLAGRSPIPVHSNFATLGDMKHKENFPVSNQLSRAANCIHGFMEYSDKIKKGSIRNMAIQNFIPLCCDRYKYICSTTRIPGKEIDELKTYSPAHHAVVFRKGYIYKVITYATDSSGKTSLLTPKEIQTQLAFIVKDADERSAKAGALVTNPCIFTTANRTKWAEIREAMLGNDVNRTSLQEVESAAFCVALDTDEPEGHSDEFHSFMTGNGFNRWFDKSMTAIIEVNNAMGINVEHASAEATLSGRMWEYMFYHCKYDDKGDATHGSFPRHDSVPNPQFLEWQLSDFEADIAALKKEFDILEGNLDAHVFILNKGKGFIKKLRLSPDGYMQLALQLAFYRLHKETPKTYETAATRLFKKGRTETIRTVSEHSVAFTKTFDDSDVPREEVIGHLKAAIRYQTKYKFDAMAGRAVDRHLLGIYLAGKLSGSVPRLFSLKPFNEYDRLSTSQSPLRYDPVISKLTRTDCVGGGFGAQREDGYGVSYFMDEYKVHFLITSYHSCQETGSLMFADAVQKAVDDMKLLMESAQSPSAQKIANDNQSNGKTNGKTH